MFAHQPTGLYGWIRSNDGRSLGLFVAFLIAVQILAIPSLFFPLLLFDVAHAPFLGWTGYFLRYAPLVLAASLIWFGWKYWRHIETVRRAVGFHFVDNSDEPYLCSVIEPLIVMWGLPIPFVGVIESPARNAFACGVGRKKAVVVVTRGLIDHLTREELSCVLAHELSHIKNGDIRLMAAANIFMSALTDLHRTNPMQMTPIHALLAVAVPAVLPMTLLGNLLGAAALRAGQMSRLLIASKREFIADAEAVQLTKNPGAMASALVKVEHAYRIKGLRSVDDSMMIAGDTDGDTATHPTVALRIAALARTTGSMVFNSPHSPSRAAFADSPSLSQAEAAALLRKLPGAQPIRRIRQSAKPTVLALDQMGQYATVFAITALLVLHWQDLDQPTTMLAKFDARPIAVMVGSPLACSSDVLTGQTCTDNAGAGTYEAFEGQNNTLVGYLAQRSRERRQAGHINPDLTLSGLSNPGVRRSEFAGQSGRLKGVMASFADADTMRFITDDGTVTRQVPEELVLAEVRQVGCFPTKMILGKPKDVYPLLSVNPPGHTLSDFKKQADGLAAAAEVSGLSEEAEWFQAYTESRENLLITAYLNWGLAGVGQMEQAFDTPGHASIVSQIGIRLGDPAFAAMLTPLVRAKFNSLVQRPRDYLPCPLLKHRNAA